MERHRLKNAVNPIITALGIQVGYLLGGGILTETVFLWPGLGSMMVRAIHARLPAGAGGRAPRRHDVRAGEPRRGSPLRGVRPADPL
ncbi:MAG: ABC transporter permease subunit [candidate division NC10 bacterium]